MPPAGAAEPVLRFAAAGNEYEAAQLVIRSETGTKLTAVEVGPLKASNGHRLPPEAITLFRVAYVTLPEYKRDYPDPLPPLAVPLQIQSRETQPLWVRVHVPSAAAPGEYRGELRLVLDAVPHVVPMRVVVWPFDLPPKPSMRTAFGLLPTVIAESHGVKPNTPEHRQLVDAYWECLVSHRISPFGAPEDVLSPEAARLLGDERLTSFVIPYSDEEARLRKTIDYLREHSWLNKGYFYVVDEPKTQEQYNRLKEICRKIQRVDPKLKIVSPYYCDPEFAKGKTPYDLLAGYINIWCPNSGYFKPEPVATRQRLDEEAWWYVCCGPAGPYANFFADMSGMSHRILMWQQCKYGIEGLLYWCTNAWGECTGRDPWADLATVKSINPKLYGDGSLLYPGRKVGVNGPVTSIRLEIIRDGLEDYEYLHQHTQRYGRDATLNIIDRLAQDLTHFEHDPAALELVRAEIAGALTPR